MITFTFTQPDGATTTEELPGCAAVMIAGRQADGNVLVAIPDVRVFIPKAWGVLVANLLQHLVQAHVDAGLDEQYVRDHLSKGFMAEMQNPGKLIRPVEHS